MGNILVSTYEKQDLQKTEIQENWRGGLLNEQEEISFKKTERREFAYSESMTPEGVVRYDC